MSQQYQRFDEQNQAYNPSSQPPSSPTDQPQYQGLGQGPPMGAPIATAYVAVPTQPYVVQGQPFYAQQQQGEMPQGPRLVGSWSDGICDCFSDWESCCLACWCPCIRWGLTLQRAGLWTFALATAIYFILRVGINLFYWPDVMYAMGPPGIPISLATVMFIALVCISMYYRQKIREKHSIHGSVVEDCLCHTFCSCCAVAQEARHIDRDLGLIPLPVGLEYSGGPMS